GWPLIVTVPTCPEELNAGVVPLHVAVAVDSTRSTVRAKPAPLPIEALSAPDVASSDCTGAGTLSGSIDVRAKPALTDSPDWPTPWVASESAQPPVGVLLATIGSTGVGVSP